MTHASHGDSPCPTVLAADLEQAHTRGAQAAQAGLQDAALGELRLTGPGVSVLAQASVSSATPFLRAPLLARLSAVRLLHPATGHENSQCGTCNLSAPCPTNLATQ